MTSDERSCAKLLLMIAMQMSSLMRAVSQTDAPEDCATGIYYTAIPDAMFPVCDPFDQPLSMLCRVKIHSNQTNMMDMNWFFAEGGVPVSSGEHCPLLEGDTGIELLNSSTRHTVIKHWDHAEQTLSVTLTINPLQEQDIGRYWCQATLSGVALSRTSAYCQRDAAQTTFIPLPCRTLFRESNVCVTQTPQATPTVLISSLFAQSSLAASIVNPPGIVAATPQPSSLSPSATSISDFSRSSYFESFAIVSSTQTQVTSLHIMMSSSSSSSSHYSQSPTSTTIHKPVSGDHSSNDVLVMSIVFCTLSAVILLVTVIIALSVIKCHRRMRRWVPELNINEGLETGQSIRQMNSQSPQPVIPKTMNSPSSDSHTRFQIHQIPQNPQHSTLQNMSINLGPSSMSVRSDIYSEIGPPLQDSSLNHHEIQRTSPPVPPRPVTSREENLYDVPETDDARSVTSHTYTLPADAREGATISSTSRNTTIEHYTSSTGDSWFGRCSPVLVIQQRYSAQADILDGIPVGINHGSVMSLQTQASSEIHETDTENDDESGVSSESMTHEPLEAYLPPDHSWVMVRLPLAQVQPAASVSLQIPLSFRSSFTEDVRDTTELRPGCATESPPSSFTRLLVSNTGKSSPAPSSSSSSGCTDLSKYSGDYERDPLYMERILQQRVAMVTTNNEFLSSAESAAYSPLSPVSPQPPREHLYTPLNCYRLEPTPAYSRLQRYSYQVIETTV